MPIASRTRGPNDADFGQCSPGRGCDDPSPSACELVWLFREAGSRVGAFVEIQKNAHVGERCKISSHTFICEGVTVEDEVFVGHGVMFINDIFPQAANEDGSAQTEADWSVVETRIKARASIGSNATIMGGITVGRSALVGAGAVVTKDVPDFAIVAGVPARVVGDVRDKRK